MTFELTLSGMPEKIFKRILDECDYSSIASLRKVCHSFRNFIEDVKPDSGVTTIEVTVSFNAAHIFYQDSSDLKLISYEDREGGCAVRLEDKQIILKNVDFAAVVLKDLDVLFQHQKTVLDGLSWNWDKEYGSFLEKNELERMPQIVDFLENLEKTLKTHQFPLQFFQLQAQNLEEIMTILPFLNPGNLEKIQILNTRGKEDTLNFDEVIKLNQWKQAKIMEISSVYIFFLTYSPMDSFTHFERIYVYMQSISSSDLDILKKAFFESTVPKDFTIVFKDLEERSDLRYKWGRPAIHDEDSEESDWFFKLPNTEQFLHIDLDTTYVYLKRVSKESIPQGVLFN